MNRFLLALTVSALATPTPAAAEQDHSGHAMPAPSQPAQSDPAQAQRPVAPQTPPRSQTPADGTAGQTGTDPHAGHAMPASPAQATPSADPHAGHRMGAPSAPPAPLNQPDPHAGHDMSGSAPGAQTPAHQADPHAGHDMGAMSGQQAADPHAGHTMPGMAIGNTPPKGPPPPGAFTGPENAADVVFGAEAMRHPREEALIDEHGGYVTYKGLVDRLEVRLRDGSDGYAWDADFWYGGDYDKLWLKTAGEGDFGGSVESAEMQALWSHTITPYFDFQAGVRYDLRPDPERAHLVLGIQGLAPYWFEVDAAAFLSDKGDFTARFEAEYDQRITQKLILQPHVEFDLAAQDVPEIGVGAGLSTIEAGLRLRYEFVPEFAPYVGVAYDRSVGNTADFARAAGENVGGWSLVLGLRSWF